MTDKVTTPPTREELEKVIKDYEALLATMKLMSERMDRIAEIQERKIVKLKEEANEILP